MRIATRINGKVTSVNVRDSICALHYLLLKDAHKRKGSKKRTPVNPQEHVLNACYNITSKWNGVNGKGLSGFIADNMILDIIDYFGVTQYHKILKTLQQPPTSSTGNTSKSK